MSKRLRSPTGWLVLVLLLSSSVLTMIQPGIINQSYGQLGTQTIPPSRRIGNQTWAQTGPPRPPTTGIQSGNQTWTQTGPPPPPWNQSWTWSHTGNESLTWIHTANYTWIGPLNQTRTQTGPPPALPGNQTHMQGGLPPGLKNGWPHSNVTIDARNFTQPVLMNGTDRVRLGYIAINASISEQIIRNVAFNESIAQVEFDRNGSVQLIINSSIRPSRVFADNTQLTEVQSVTGLTPESEAWVYDPNTHALIIFADPSSVTIIYASATTQVPEFPYALGLIMFVCLAASVIISKRRTAIRDGPRTGIPNIGF